MTENIWMIRAGQGGYLAAEFASKNVVAIGWDELGDLTELQSREKIHEQCRAAYPKDKPGKIITSVSVVHRFRNVIREGDGVVTYDPATREYLVGEITGDYQFDPTIIAAHPNIRRVEWRSRVSRDALPSATRNMLGSIITIFAISPEAWEELQSKGQHKSETRRDKEEEKPDFAEIKRSREDEAHESLKDKLLELDEYQMQELLASILRAMGFKSRVSPRGPDRGVDVFASPDGLGLQEPRIKAEVKHRGGATGAQDLRSFIGGLRPGDRALYLSTGGFSKDAKYEADRSNIPLTLIDLDTLATLVEQHYEAFDSEGRGLLPLTRIYWPSE
ncbi:MAG TPA: restriction endonuclease [Chthoniobacterales bacterium]|nr:restriction endonuclease [Chthoniobacterales bacterium]